MNPNSNHMVRELQQVNLLLKKITTKTEKPLLFEHKIKELEQVNVLAKKILKSLHESSDISPKLLENIHNDLRTPLTPVKGYVQLLVSENFGSLNDSQKKKLQIVLENLDKLENTIKKLF